MSSRSRSARLGRWFAVVILAVGCSSSRGPDPAADPPPPVSSPPPADAPVPLPDPPAPDPDPAKSGPTMGDRAQSAVEGLVIGAIVGSQAGPIGSAVFGGALMIYSAVTGRVPLGDHPGGVDSEREREESMEDQIETEVARQDDLESQIEEELKRQEELLEQIEREEAEREQGAPQTAAIPGPADLEDRADPRSAPPTPGHRDLPIAIFEKESVTIEKGTWGNDRKLEVEKLFLDADQDGRPEEVRYLDQRTGLLVRREEDRNYDGSIDAWSRYEAGALVERTLDESGDGQPDAWESYAGGRMTAAEKDRDADGTRDVFYRYAGDDLVEERHDTNDDGRVDRTLYYESRRLARSEEDRDADGRTDTWSYYAAVDGEEVVVRIEKDSGGHGKADTFETYAQKDGKTVIERREEDKNGDGVIDVTSIYEDGKLKRREVSDPALVPL
jgi:hypothetical protein